MGLLCAMNHGTVVVVLEENEENDMTIPKELEGEILRLHYAEKWRVNTIATQLKVHHSTVERVLTNNGVTAEQLRIRPSIADPYIPLIKSTLKKYPKLSATRIFHMCRERGYPGGVDHFRDIVAKHRPRAATEAYLRVRTMPGEQAQVDWGSFGRVRIGNAERKLYAFVMVLSWSRHIFLRFYVNQSTSNFLHGHVDAFEYFGAVPREILYDNLKSVVVERIGKAIRFNSESLDLASHYKFKPVPVEVGQPASKGRVERGIQYIRTSFFEARQWKDLNDLNQQALEWCSGESAERRWVQNEKKLVKEAFEEDRRNMLALPKTAYPVYDRETVKAGKTPYIRFDGNDYSVPAEHVKKTLSVVATLSVVKVCDGEKEICEHERSFDKGRQIEQRKHVEELEDLKRAGRKHRAMDVLQEAAPACTEFFVRAAERSQNLGRLTQDLTKLLEAYGAPDFELAVKHALDVDTIYASAVKQALDLLRSRRGQKEVIPLHFLEGSKIDGLILRPNSLDVYDRMYELDAEDNE